MELSVKLGSALFLKCCLDGEYTVISGGRQCPASSPESSVLLTSIADGGKNENLLKNS